MKKDIFISVLKKELKSKKITQEEFACKIGIAYPTLKKYLSAKSPELPKIDILITMCEILQCDSDYLLGMQPHPRKETTDICAVTGLSSAAVAALKARKNDHDDEYASELPGTLELKALNCILEHGQDKDGYMCSTIFTHIGHLLFSHFVDASKINEKDRVIHISGSDKYFISPSAKDKISLYDETNGYFIDFRIEDLQLSQMECIRKSIYLLQEELSSK